MRKTNQQPMTSTQPRALATDELARIHGGDAASGMPTGKRQHDPS